MLPSPPNLFPRARRARARRRVHAASPPPRHAERRAIILAFGTLGFFVGVWAVLLADLTEFLDLRPSLLGLALTTLTGAGIVLLPASGRLADRHGRRPLLIAGIAGTALLCFALVATRSLPALFGSFVLGGVAASCFDVAINALGGDYERQYEERVMPIFHAGFSGGAAAGAFLSGLVLTAGVGFRTTYLTLGLLLIGLAVLFAWLPLPNDVPATRAYSRAPLQDARDGDHRLLRVQGIRVAALLVGSSFLIDAALEGYASIYLRTWLASGPLLGAGSLAVFYLAGMASRLASAVLLRRFGDQLILIYAGGGTALGLLIAAATTQAPVAAVGLLLIGISLAPVAPIAYSLVGRAAPRRAAQAASLVTIAGYAAFVVSPSLGRALAETLSLRLALLCYVLAAAGIIITALRGRAALTSSPGDAEDGAMTGCMG